MTQDQYEQTIHHIKFSSSNAKRMAIYSSIPLHNTTRLRGRKESFRILNSKCDLNKGIKEEKRDGERGIAPTYLHIVSFFFSFLP